MPGERLVCCSAIGSHTESGIRCKWMRPGRDDLLLIRGLAEIGLESNPEEQELIPAGALIYESLSSGWPKADRFSQDPLV